MTRGQVATFVALASVAFNNVATGRVLNPSPPAALAPLDAVEQALTKVEHAAMSPEQKKVTTKVVGDIEQTIAALKNSSALALDQRKVKAKFAMDKLNSLQSLWELFSVESSLMDAIHASNLPSQLREKAKKVVADIDGAIDEVESGKVTKAADRGAKVVSAIGELKDLQQEWAKSVPSAKSVTSDDKVESLEKQLAEKKALLSKTEKELKLAGLEKDLLEKKQMLKHLVEQKHEAEAREEEQREDASQRDMVAKLLATAKSIAAAQGSAKPDNKQDSKPARQENRNFLSKDRALQPILASLKAQAQNVSQSIAKLDADEAKREQELQQSMKAPTLGKKDALEKGQAMLKSLVKRSHRSFQKARALREKELKELNDGISSVEKGDVSALAALMSKMQSESKNMEAKTNGFLY